MTWFLQPKEIKMAKILNKTNGVTAPKSNNTSTALAPLTMPPSPTTSAAVATFITQGTIAITKAVEVMKSCPASSGLYSKVLEFAQEVAGMVLDEGVKIADEVRAVGQTQGSGQTVKAAQTAKNNIMTNYGFKPGKRWRNICELDADCVEQAKEEAKTNGDIPSINSALTIKKERKPKNPKLGIYDCHGVFSDVTLPVGLKFDTPWKATSLFANIGLGTYLLKNLNIEVAVANELHANRAQIHQELYPGCKVIPGSITDPDVYKQILKAHKENGCRIVLISPPCQSYSKAGTQNVNRADASLVVAGMQLLEDSNDTNDIFMCENVPEFLGACPNKIKNKHYDTIYDYVKETTENIGYITSIYYLNADCYGTAETRNRAIIIGIKKDFLRKLLGTDEITPDMVWKFPKPDEFKISEEACLQGIPSIEAGEHRADFNRLHYAIGLNQAVIDALKDMKAGEQAVVKTCNTKGELEKVTIKRAHGDRPAPTITGETAHFRAKALHFPAGRGRTDGTQSDARYRTCYEILLLMGMPRDFVLPDNIKIKDGQGNIWCKDGPVPETDPSAINPGDIVVSDDEFRTMLGEHYCPTVVNRCFEQLIYQIQNKDF